MKKCVKNKCTEWFSLNVEFCETIQFVGQQNSFELDSGQKGSSCLGQKGIVGQQISFELDSGQKGSSCLGQKGLTVFCWRFVTISQNPAV